MNERLLTGTVTLLLGDVEDFARWGEIEPDAMTALTDVVAAHGGVRPKRDEAGDRVVAFACASDAVAAAVALQRAAGARVRLRIGVHTGEVQTTDDAGYSGPTVERAARLRDLAHEGQILLSGVSQELVADRLPAGVWLLDLGGYALPGVVHPERVVQVCHPELVNEFPPLRATEPAGRHGLPVQLTSFVGRRAELSEVGRLVGSDRLVTLTGAGGVGKSRLAAQLAGQVADGFGDGVWWVDLAPITDPDLVAVRVAGTLGLPDQPGRSTTDTVSRFIAGRRMLVVLDNCEHLLDACAPLVNDLLGACPALTVMATSREPLGVTGELTWRTPSLSLADEAVELFAQRARLTRPDFAITGGNAAVVAEICRRLDGVPLAIELAAARVRALSLPEILEGLRDRFRLLTGWARTAVPRQQTLHASVDWSHALLSGLERVVFRRLAVFLGSFDLDGACTVVGGDELQRHQVVDVVSLLVGKSLVVADNSRHETRYRLLETIRHYALDKLGESDEADAARTRHRDHYTALFGVPVTGGLKQRIERAEIEIDNFRAAFAWSLGNGDFELAARLASSLQPLWVRGRIAEGLAWFDGIATDDPVVPATRARTLADRLILNHLAGTLGRMDEAEQALGIARDLDNPVLLAWVLTACGCTCLFRPELALPYFAEAIDLSRAAGDDWQLAQVLGWQALSFFVAGDPAAGVVAGKEGRDLAEAIGEDSVSRVCRWCIGLTRWLTADLTEGAAYLADVASEARAAHHLLIEAVGSQALGMVRAYQGDVGGARAAANSANEAAAVLTVGFHQGASLGAFSYASLAAGDVAAAAAASTKGWAVCGQTELLAINCDPIAQAMLRTPDTVAVAGR